MPDQASEKVEVKMYSDFKSPYAYLAFDPGMSLGQRFDVRVRWIPFQLRLKGKGERSVYSEYKVKYSYRRLRRTKSSCGVLRKIKFEPRLLPGIGRCSHSRTHKPGLVAWPDHLENVDRNECDNCRSSLEC
jgi:2-hydroxychromene-2-carboxylate isomerase